MHDPVVLADGHTYERRYIERWLRRNDTSPVTGLRLSQRDIFPNHALRNAIEEYFQQVFSAHRRAIRRTVAGPSAEETKACYSSNNMLLRTIDALMQCSLLVNADHSTEYVLRQIMEEAKALVGAEVASVFLVDPDRQSLFSTVNSTGGEIRIPIDAGIAGHVASTGQPEVIHDAYGDSRFNRSVDTKTGFRTRSIMCVPLKVRKCVIGVAQLINKTGGGLLSPEQQRSRTAPDGFSTGTEEPTAFTADDLQFLQVFASQAATAIAGSATPEDLQPQAARSGSGASESVASLKAAVAPPPQVAGEDEKTRPLEDSSEDDGVDDEDLDDALTRRLDACESLLSEAYESWKFDALALDEASNHRPLSVLGGYIFDRSGLVGDLELDREKLRRFLLEIEQGYDDNPYHNRCHAASVLHSTHAMLEHTDLAQLAASAIEWQGVGQEVGERLVRVALLLAAAVHDFEHRGVSNDFMIRTLDDRAILYNDRNVNESHHVAAAFAVLRRPEFNFLSSLPAKAFRQLRTLVISAVLGTDMGDHGAILKAFVETAASNDVGASAGAIAPPFRPKSEQEAKLLLQMAIKCSDLGHLMLDWDLHLQWVALLEDENFAQGDREKALGLSPVSFLMDREKPGASQTQVGFMDFMVLPLFRALGAALPGAEPMLRGVEENYGRWKALDGAPEAVAALMHAVRAARSPGSPAAKPAQRGCKE